MRVHCTDSLYGQASELLGAIMLADADTKPALLDDEFYVPDLIGVVVAIQVSPHCKSVASLWQGSNLEPREGRS